MKIFIYPVTTGEDCQPFEWVCGYEHPKSPAGTVFEVETGDDNTRTQVMAHRDGKSLPLDIS